MFRKTVGQIKRFLKILIGFTLLLAGAIMWFTPGPGWITVIAGLAILSPEFDWACRLLKKIKEIGIRIRDAVMPSDSKPAWRRPERT